MVVDLLKNSVAITATGVLPFPALYRQHVEEPYAKAFIERLYASETIEPTATALWADVARRIATDLTAAGLYAPDLTGTRLLLAYCLYWWRSFTLGYALEIEVQKDLQQAGIEFAAHNLLRRDERLSPYDIRVLGFKGDIKTSLYFLQAARSQTLPHDFYITKLSGPQGARIMVVFVQQGMWKVINGETVLALLEEIAATLPQAARIRHRGLELTVIDYETWKEKVQRQQKKRKSNE